MIVKRKNTNYSNKVKHVRGAGFMDVMGGIGSYIGQNKDLIAKPLLSSIGEAGGILLKEGARAIINKHLSRKQGGGIKKF